MTVYHDCEHIFSDVQLCLEATSNHHFKNKDAMLERDSRTQNLLNLKSNNKVDHLLPEDGAFLCRWPLMISIYHVTSQIMLF